LGTRLKYVGFNEAVPVRVATDILRLLISHPFTTSQQTAGYRYEISMCQVEFALTQIVVRPVHGRTFFEEVLRENLDVAERSIIDPFSPDADWPGGNLALPRKMKQPCGS
jgi:hypothetical protein